MLYCDTKLTACAFIWYIILINTPILRYAVADLISPHPSFRTFCPWTMLYESVLTPTHVQMILMGAPLNMITAVIRYILVSTCKSPHLSALCKWLNWGDFLLHLAHNYSSLEFDRFSCMLASISQLFISGSSCFILRYKANCMCFYMVYHTQQYANHTLGCGWSRFPTPFFQGVLTVDDAV